jgi:hypothetical protein
LGRRSGGRLEQIEVAVIPRCFDRCTNRWIDEPVGRDRRSECDCERARELRRERSDPHRVDAVQLAVDAKAVEHLVALVEELANLLQLRIGCTTHDNLAAHAAKASNAHDDELLTLGAAPEDEPTLLLPKKLGWLCVVVCSCVCVCSTAVLDVAAPPLRIATNVVPNATAATAAVNLLATTRRRLAPAIRAFSMHPVQPRCVRPA